MVKKTFFKSILKTFLENKGRFLVICMVVMLGVSFVAGLGTLSSSLTDSLNDSYTLLNGADLVLKSTSFKGFTKDEIEVIKKLSFFQEIKEVTSIEQNKERFFYWDFDEDLFHRLEIVEGREILGADEVLVDQVSDVSLHEIISFQGQDFKVVGKVRNPFYYVMESEYTWDGNPLHAIYYFDVQYTKAPSIVTDLYLKVRQSENIFTSVYEELVEEGKSFVSVLPNTIILSLSENLSFSLAKNYGDKISFLAFLFPVFFILISALVVYSTIKRLIEEEREVIGCYRSLGISKGLIVFKYFLFALIPCIIGSLAGFFVGIHLFPHVIYPAFDALFYMPIMTEKRFIWPGLFTAFLMLLLLIFIPLVVIFREMRGATSELLKPKSPKSGKKIWLEKLPFLWGHFSFKYKSSFRNIFRYKANFWMTFLSVAGGCALTFAGFGLYAIAVNPNTTEIPIRMADSFSLISLVIILFAALLCVLVIFNVTNMNIQERKREIATLRVLGYQQKEVCLYIYREINLMSILGILGGILIGYYFLNFIFHFLEFGTIQDVNWYYYLLTIFVVCFFVFLAQLLLIHKIRHIDMNGSLKSIE